MAVTTGRARWRLESGGVGSSTRQAMVIAIALGLSATATFGNIKPASASPFFEVTATIPVGFGPSGVAVDPSTHHVYVANEQSGNQGSTIQAGTVSVIDESGDARTGTVVANIPTRINPIEPAVDPTSHNVYVTNESPDAGLVVIDESGDARTGTVVAHFPVGLDPGGVAVDPTSHNVYVANADDNLSHGTLSVIHEPGGANTGTVVANIPVGEEPVGVAVDPTTHKVYVTNAQSGSVSVIDESGDATSGTVVATIPVPDRPGAVAVDPTTHKVYVASAAIAFGADGTLSVIDESGDATSGTVVATIPVGVLPAAVAVDPTTHDVYVTNAENDSVSVIDEPGDAGNGTVVATIPVGGWPDGVAVDPGTDNVYVANQTSNTVSVITVTVEHAPVFIAASPPLAARANEPYAYSFNASGFPAPRYSLGGGAPSWLTIDALTGAVSGTVPRRVISFAYTVTATNSVGSAVAGPFSVVVRHAR